MNHPPEAEGNLQNHKHSARLAKQLDHEFDKKGLQNLCFQMGIDYENLRGETKNDLARELVQYCFRRNLIAELEVTITKATAGRRDRLTQYRQQLLNETQFLELKGIPVPLGRDGQPRYPHLPLDEIYIRLQAIAKGEKEQQEKEEEQELADKAERANSSLDRRDKLSNDFLGPVQRLGEHLYRRGHVYETEERPAPIDPQMALQEHRRAVVLGAPGSGKSTMLRYIARRAAENSDGPIPILVSLRDFATAKSQSPLLSLRQFALEQTTLGDVTLHGALSQVIDAERVLWLLDGLDEARDLARETSRQIGKLPGLLLLTSRPVGYVDHGLKSLPHFEVLPLDSENIVDFIYSWMKLMAGGRKDGIEEANERLEHLEDQLDKKPQLQALTQNPLLLTFLVTLVDREIKPELPDHRVELYARYIVELMEWEISRQIEGVDKTNWKLGPLEGEVARIAVFDGFHYLGWALHLHYHGGKGQVAPDKSLLIKALTHYYKKDNYPKPKNLAEAVFVFWQHAGLLDVWRIGSQTYLAFRHLTFQEYAAAWGLNRAFQKNKRIAWEFLSPRVHHYAWREPILLCVGLLDNNNLDYLVRRLLLRKGLDESILHLNLRLAKVLETEKPLNNKTSQKIKRRLNRLNRLSQRNSWALYYMLWLFTVLLVPYVIYVLYWQHLRWGSSLLIIIWGLLFVVSHFAYERDARFLVYLKSWIQPCIPDKVLSNLEGSSGIDITYFFRRLTLSEKSNIQKPTESIKDIRDPAQVLELCAEASHRDDFLSDTAIATLKNIGSDVVPYLIDVLTDSSNDTNVRWDVANGLGFIKDSTAVPHLISILSDPSSKMRCIAAVALGNIGDRSATASLIRALADNDDSVRGATILALGQIGDPIALPPLISALSDPAIHAKAVVALGYLGDQKAVAHLIKALDGPVPDLAAFSLGNIGDISAVPHLISILATNSSKSTIRWVVQALAKLPLDSSTVPHLIAVLDNDDTKVRVDAIEALGNIGDSTAVPHIIATMENTYDKMVQKSACKALGKIGQVEAIPTLLTYMANKDVYESAMQALNHMRKIEALPYFIDAINDKDELIRRFAAKTLGHIGDLQAVPYLLNAKSDWCDIVQDNATKALEKIKDSAPISKIITALTDKNITMRLFAVEALIRRGDITVTPYLVNALNDPYSSVRARAAIALGQIGDVTAIPALITALKDKDGSVRYFSIQALGEIAGNSDDLSTMHSLRKVLLLRLNDHKEVWEMQYKSYGEELIVSQIAFFALEHVVTQITKLEVADLPLLDPLG